MFENYKQECNCYTHEALSYYYQQYKDKKMSLPEYMQCTTNMLDKVYGKNSLSKQLKQGRWCK